ncbi:hypothetical protein ACXC9Q_11190 [Kribbella sp. CWNU-51]
MTARKGQYVGTRHTDPGGGDLAVFVAVFLAAADVHGHGVRQVTCDSGEIPALGMAAMFLDETRRLDGGMPHPPGA